MKFKRILLKLSGEALMGNQKYGIDTKRLEFYADEIKKAVDDGTQIGIVIGGGNIFRGLQGISKGMERAQGDYMGMFATIINSMALQSALEAKEIRTELFSSFKIGPVAQEMTSKKAIESLEQGKVVIIGGGTGNPYFTTDTASVLRALEIKANLFLKGTRVDGIYTSDPEKDPEAEKYIALTFEEAIQKKLQVMDLTAFAMCQENELPIIVFNMNIVNNLLHLLEGEAIGTIVN